MQFEKNCMIFCYSILIIILSCEISQLGLKANSLQLEIYSRKIDLLSDKDGVIRLLPGIGPKKAEEAIRLRKEVRSAEEIIEKIGLKNQQNTLKEILDHESEL